MINEVVVTRTEEDKQGAPDPIEHNNQQEEPSEVVTEADYNPAMDSNNGQRNDGAGSDPDSHSNDDMLAQDCNQPCSRHTTNSGQEMVLLH